jgi:hypothetical protein
VSIDAGGADARGGASGTGNSGGDAGAGGVTFTKRGFCAERGEGFIHVGDAEQSYVRVEFYVVSEEALDAEMLEPLVCLVELDMTVVGPGPSGCADLDLSQCRWSYELELRDPRVLVDEQGACAANELRYDASWLERMHGSRVAYGFLESYGGHDSVLMKYEPGPPGAWKGYGRAFWDEETGEFVYDSRYGRCGY